MTPALGEAAAAVDVLGVRVAAVDLERAVDVIDQWVQAREQHYVCVTGVHGVMEARRDPDLREVHNRAGLVVADGMPLVWAGRYAHAATIGRVCGRELMPAVLARAAERGWSSYFYGGAPGIPERLAERFREQLPSLRVAGTWSPPYRELTAAEDDEVVARINAASPDLLWVGLGAPKQERWMAAHVGRLHVPVLLGVGAAFDMHAGVLRTPPHWLQDAGLEWLYRLAHEPRRLWRRYLRNNPAFVAAVLREPPHIEPYPSEPGTAGAAAAP